MQYRLAIESDIPAMAGIRDAEWGTGEYWRTRIKGYMLCEHHPQLALKPRTMYVAVQGDVVVGFIAGHLTRRYECDGELEWINVISQHRGSGTASELLRLLARWFIGQNAFCICVDVDPLNLKARTFYMRHGAKELNKHWLVWHDIHIALHE